MYEEFDAVERWSKERIHCAYQALIVAISTRHADAVDIKFMVGGRSVWISLPCLMWVEYEQETGRKVTDPLAVQVAGHYLKYAIESGLDGGREMYSLTKQQAMEHLHAVLGAHGEPPQQPITPWPEPERFS
ncbi:MAG TPA: hypothetical protein VKB56_03845 [Terriglobales bacterium]|nr:hypothetical protein [Terriglobales bacterium]